MARQYGTPEVPEHEKKNQKGYSDRKDSQPKPKAEDPSPPNRVVTDFHKNASVDTSATDVHHTLGAEPNQASPGAHTHNGGDSALLLEGFTMTGSRSNAAQMAAAFIPMFARLGAKDSTTA